MLCQGLVCPRINVFEVNYLERLLAGPSSLCVSESRYWFLRCRINALRNTAHSILVSTWYVPLAPLRFNTLKQASKRHLPLPFPPFSFSLPFHLSTHKNRTKYAMFPQASCSCLYLIIFHYVHKMICSCFVQQEGLLFLSATFHSLLTLPDCCCVAVSFSFYFFCCDGF